MLKFCLEGFWGRFCPTAIVTIVPKSEQTRDQTDHVMGVDHVNDLKSNSSIKTNYLRRTWVLFLYRNLKWLRKTFNSSFWRTFEIFCSETRSMISQNNGDLSHIFEVSDYPHAKIQKFTCIQSLLIGKPVLPIFSLGSWTGLEVTKKSWTNARLRNEISMNFMHQTRTDF